MPPKKVGGAKDAGELALPSIKPKSLAGQTVIISGEIEDYDRKTAQKILESAGATYAKSLNKSVTLVVLGGNAGSKKLQKIQEMGVETKEWDMVLTEIEAGDGGVEEDEDEIKAGEEFEPDEEAENEDAEMEEPEPAPVKSKASKASKKKDNKKEAKPVANTSKSRASAKVSSSFSLDGKTVIVSGTVPGHTRKTANELLEKEGADLAKSLNKDVELVILGVNPGPDKLKKIDDLGIETLKWEELAQQLGWDYTGEDELEGPPEPQTLSAAPSSIEGKVVLITGTVEGHTRSSAQKALEKHGPKFAKSLNKDVELVILGANPGPDKLGKINDLGIPTTEWADLAQKLGLDEDSGPPKKKARKR